MASRSRPIKKNLSDAMTCGICKDKMIDPTEIGCGHSFCKNCIAKLCENSQKPNETIPFKCPLCRKPFTLGSDGVDGLPINYPLKDIAENCPSIMSSDEGSLQDQTGDTERCTECKVQLEVIQICMNCNIRLCKSCSQDHQSDHAIIDVKDFQHIMGEFAGDNTCHEHSSQILEMYCIDDDIPVCNTCVLLKHTHHKIISLSDHVAKKRRHLDKLENRCYRLLHEYDCKELSGKERRGMLTKNTTAAQDYADEIARDVTVMILKEKESLLQDKQENSKKIESRILSCMAQMKSSRQKTKDLHVRIKCLKMYGSFRSISEDKMSKILWSEITKNKKSTDVSEINIDINFSRTEFLTRCIERMQSMLQDQNPQRHQSPQIQASHNAMDMHKTPGPGSQISSDVTVLTSHQELDLDEETGVKKIYKQEDENAYYQNRIQNEAESDTRQVYNEMDLMGNIHGTDECSENGDSDDAFTNQLMGNNAVVQEQTSDGELMEDVYYDDTGARPEYLSTDPKRPPKLSPRRYQSGNLQEQNEGSRSDLRRNESDDDTFGNKSDGQNRVGCPDEVIEGDQTHEERCIDPHENVLGVRPECLSTHPYIPPKLPPKRYQSGNLQKQNEGSRSDLRRNESDDDTFGNKSDGQNRVGCPDEVIEGDQTHEERCIDPHEDVLGAKSKCLSSDPKTRSKLPISMHESAILQKQKEGSRSDLRRNESDYDTFGNKSDGQNRVGCPDEVIEGDQTHEERCIDPHENVLGAKSECLSSDPKTRSKLPISMHESAILQKQKEGSRSDLRRNESDYDTFGNKSDGQNRVGCPDEVIEGDQTHEERCIDPHEDVLGTKSECLSSDPKTRSKLPISMHESAILQKQKEGSRSDLRRNESDDDTFGNKSDGQNRVGCPDEVIEGDQTHEERCIDPHENVLGATSEFLSTHPNIPPKLPPRRYQSGNMQEQNEGSRSDLRRNESDDDTFGNKSDGQNRVGCPDEVIEGDQTHEGTKTQVNSERHEREVDGEMHIPECQLTAERQFYLKMSVTGLAMTPKDEIVVVLENSNAVLVFDLRGKLIGEVVSESIGNPWDLAIVNDHGNEWTVYLTDSGEKTHGVKTIKKHKKKYKVDIFTTNVKKPRGISASLRNIFVCDISPQNIKVFDIRTRRCERIIENGQRFHTPVFISTTQEGDMVVTSLTSSKGDESIRVITPEGSLKQVYGPLFPKPFSPTHTCIRPNGNLYIADQGSNEIYFISKGKISKLPYRKFGIKPIAMSFDKCGNLWVSSRSGQFVKFTL